MFCLRREMCEMEERMEAGSDPQKDGKYILHDIYELI